MLMKAQRHEKANNIEKGFIWDTALILHTTSIISSEKENKNEMRDKDDKKLEIWLPMEHFGIWKLYIPFD